MFKGKRGAQLAKDIARRSKTFNPGAGLPTDKKKGGPSPGDVEAIKNSIANASTLAEVERLKGLLQSGQIPGRERRSGPMMTVKRRWKKTRSRMGPQQDGLSIYRTCNILLGQVLLFELGIIALFVSPKWSS